jgi:hypothetical protein
MHVRVCHPAGAALAIAGSILLAAGALADPLIFTFPARFAANVVPQDISDRPVADRIGDPAEIPSRHGQRRVDDPTGEASGIQA